MDLRVDGAGEHERVAEIVPLAGGGALPETLERPSRTATQPRSVTRDGVTTVPRRRDRNRTWGQASPGLVAGDTAFERAERLVEQDGEQRDEDTALKHEGEVVGGKARNDDLAQAPRPRCCRWRPWRC